MIKYMKLLNTQKKIDSYEKLGNISKIIKWKSFLFIVYNVFYFKIFSIGKGDVFMKQLKRFLMFTVSLVLLFVLAMPSISAEAMATKELSRSEVDALLSESLFYQSEELSRPVTEYEFIQIENMVKEKTNENPEEKVDIQEVLEELGLDDVGFVKEEVFDAADMISPMFLAVGSVGFSNYSRTSKSFLTRAHVTNSIPLTKIDQIAGFLKGYSILPNTNAYVLQNTTYFSELRVPYGVTKVTALKSVPHFGKNAKFEISAVVNNSGKTKNVFNKGISHPDGRFSQ